MRSIRFKSNLITNYFLQKDKKINFKFNTIVTTACPDITLIRTPQN